MEEKNIYGQSEGPEDSEPKYSVDLTMAEARRRVVRSIVLVLLGGACLLAAVIMFIVPDKDREESYGPGAETETERDAGAIEQTSGAAALLAPELEAMARNALTERDEAAAQAALNPQQAAEAMGQIRLARQCAAARQWDQAEEHAGKALQIYPSMNAAMRLLGFVYLQRGQFDQAIAVLEEAQRLDPFNVETFNNLATAYMQRTDMDKAEELLLASLQIQPDYTLSQLNLGLLYLARSEYQLALNNLEQALPKVPDDINVRNNVGVAQLRLGRYNEAREHFQTIIKKNPTASFAYFNMAITYVMEGDEKKAIEWIEDGAQHCSPSVLKNYLADADFDPIRNQEAFQFIMSRITPRLPTGPGSAK